MKKIVTVLMILIVPQIEGLIMAEDVGNLPSEKTNSSIISVELAEKRGGKPPMRVFYVKLSVTNTHNQPVWYITRYYGDHPLSTNKPFKAIDPWQRGYEIHNAYNGERFGGKGQFRMERFIGAHPPGEDQHSFTAFRLPSGGTLTHDFFPIESWSDIASIEIWEASEIKVNGEVPLDVWLPYEVTSSAVTHITKQAYWEMMYSGAFQWKQGKSSSDYPKEVVKSMIPTVMLKRTLPIKGIEEKNKPNSKKLSMCRSAH